MLGRLTETARRRRRLRTIGRTSGVIAAVVILGGGLALALVGLGGLGSDPPLGAPPADCGPPEKAIDIAAVRQEDGIGFDDDCVSTRSGTPFMIRFRNTLPGTESISIYTERPECTRDRHQTGVHQVTCDPLPIFDGEPVVGGGSAAYEFGPLSPGIYEFQSDRHFEELFGTLEVE